MRLERAQPATHPPAVSPQSHAPKHTTGNLLNTFWRALRIPHALPGPASLSLYLLTPRSHRTRSTFPYSAVTIGRHRAGSHHARAHALSALSVSSSLPRLALLLVCSPLPPLPLASPSSSSSPSHYQLPQHTHRSTHSIFVFHTSVEAEASAREEGQLKVLRVDALRRSAARRRSLRSLGCRSLATLLDGKRNRRVRNAARRSYRRYASDRR
jgi:hypothetical protein